MTTDKHGVLYQREGVDNRTPFAVGDQLTGYELAEPWPYSDLPPHRGIHVRDEAYARAVMQHAKPSDWREQEKLRCTCFRTIAALVTHAPSARLWVTLQPEKVPSAFRSEGGNLREGYPLHGEPDQAPHVGGVASCKGCDKRWLVVSFVDHAELIRVTKARHGVTVEP